MVVATIVDDVGDRRDVDVTIFELFQKSPIGSLMSKSVRKGLNHTHSQQQAV